MTGGYDNALVVLYQAPLEAFVAERKRLAAELKTSGDKPGAARLAKLPRPPVTAWVVNQLYWHVPALFAELLESAGRVRDGDAKALASHREALSKLRARATKLLGEASHGASEATLRRVSMTLSALAAAGSFDPDPPGALSADREPPGFEVFGIGAAGSGPVPAARPTRPAPVPAKVAAGSAEREEKDAETKRRAADADERARREKERARAEAEAEQRRLEEQARREAAAREKRRVERARLKQSSDGARTELEARERDAVDLRRQLASAERALQRARESANTAAERLAEFDAED